MLLNFQEKSILKIKKQNEYLNKYLLQSSEFDYFGTGFSLHNNSV